MTKSEIMDDLLIIKESLKGNAKVHYSQSDDANDYHFGYGAACENYAERVERLDQKVRDDVVKANRR